VPGTITVLAFAGARDAIGAGEIVLALDDLGDALTVQSVMDAVCSRFPALAPHRPIIRVAVNGSYVEGAAPVAAGDEVALIPPVAGG
jgi:molybdopterin converting factor subunit 1